MYKNQLSRAIILSMNNSGDVNPVKLRENMKTCSSDRRFSLTILAATTPIKSAIISYRGCRIYFYIDANGVITIE